MNTFLRSAEFHEWLSELADLKAKARILERLRSATLGNLATANPLATAFRKCVSMLVQGTAYISAAAERPSIFCCAVATRFRNGETSCAPEKWPAT